MITDHGTVQAGPRTRAREEAFHVDAWHVEKRAKTGNLKMYNMRDALLIIENTYYIANKVIFI